MRIYLLLFLLTGFSMQALSQSNQTKATQSFIDRLIKEKVRVPLDSLDIIAKAHYKNFPSSPALPFYPSSSIVNRSGESIVHDDEKAESEVHAAINPTDTNNIIVSAILQDPSNFLDPIKVTVYYTTDFGGSWQSSDIPFNPVPSNGFPLGGGDPVLAFDKDGKAYLSWLALTLGQSSLPLKLTLYLATSIDQGQTWSTPIVIEQGAASIEVLTGGQGTGALVDKQWMAVDQTNTAYEGNLYVSYTRFDIVDSSTMTSNILVETKPKAAAMFGAAVQVNQGTYAFMQFSSIDVDPTGGVHVSFLAGNSNTEIALYHAQSTDGGATFQAEKKVSDIYFPGLLDGSTTDILPGMPADRLYPCPHIKSGTTPGLLYASWCSSGLQQKETPGFDIWLAKSTDSGQNWDTPVRVNLDDDPQTQQYYPALTVSPNGVLCISYYDRTSDPSGTNTNYVMTYSEDEGNSFKPPLLASSATADFSQISSLNGGFGIGEYTQVVATDYHAIPVWADGRSNNGDIDIYAAILSLSDPLSGVGDIGTITDAFSVSIPNPSKGQIQLQFELKKATTTTMRVYTTDGRQVFFEKTNQKLSIGTYKRQIPIATPGIYICAVETEFGYKVRRILVQ